MFVFQSYDELVMHFGWGICCKSFHIKPHSCSLPEETLAYIFLLFPITIILIELSLGGRPKINFALLDHIVRACYFDANTHVWID